MIILRFIYYVFLKPIARIIFDLPDYEPKKKVKSAGSGSNNFKSSNTKFENSAILKGHAFEEFIAKKLNANKNYVLKDWRGDKYADGTFAESNLYPDLEFEVTKGKICKRFAIECKWRNNFTDGKLDLFKETQLTNYWRYSAEKNIPVFVAIGVGNSGNSPRELFILPLSKVKKTWMYRSELQDYKLDSNRVIEYNSSDHFFFHI